MIERNSTSAFDTLLKLSNLKVLERLGAGNFGEVYKGNSELTLTSVGEWEGAPVALKKLKSLDDFVEFEKEASVLK